MGITYPPVGIVCAREGCEHKAVAPRVTSAAVLCVPTRKADEAPAVPLVAQAFPIEKVSRAAA